MRLVGGGVGHRRLNRHAPRVDEPPEDADEVDEDDRAERQVALWVATHERIERFLPGFLDEIVPAPPPPPRSTIPHYLDEHGTARRGAVLRPSLLVRIRLQPAVNNERTN